MSRFIDEHRGRFGVEPICRVLGVSASAYYQRATRRALGPGGRGRAAARRASASCTRPTTTPTDRGGCGRRCARAGEPVGARPRRAADARARHPGRQAPRQAVAHHDARSVRARAGPISSQRDFTAAGAEPALGRRHHLPALLGGRGVLRLRPGRLLAPDRRLAVRRRTCAPSSSWTRCGWRSTSAARAPTSSSCTTPIAAATRTQGVVATPGCR